MKNIRNNLLNDKRFIFPLFKFDGFKDPINVPGREIKRNLFHDIHDKDAVLEANLRKAPKLTAKELHPRNCKQNFPTTLAAGLRQTWKTWKNRVFFCYSGNTWKTQGILRKYFKFLENSGNSVEIGLLINLLYILATIYVKRCSSLFTLHTTVIAGFFYLVDLSGWLLFEMTYSGCVFQM